VARGLRVGGTVNRWFRGYSQERFRSFVPRGRQATDQDIDYGLRGWNFNLGLIWSPAEAVNIGLVGKTAFTGELRLERVRTDYFSEIPDPLLTTTNGPVAADDVRLDFPGAVGAGVSWRARSALTISADYTRTFWSDGRIHNFFTVQATEPGKAPPAPLVYPELPYPTLDDVDVTLDGHITAFNQFDTTQVRLGIEYVLIGSKVKVPLRAGAFTDLQYFADRDGDPPLFTGFSVGSGLIIGPLMFDVAYVREQNTYPDPEGTPSRVTSVFQRFFVSLIYRHGG
jgi:hypothetical protein